MFELPPPSYTLPETNSFSAPENRPKHKRKWPRIPSIHFQVRTVSFREGKWKVVDTVDGSAILQTS